MIHGIGAHGAVQRLRKEGDALRNRSDGERGRERQRETERETARKTAHMTAHMTPR